MSRVLVCDDELLIRQMIRKYAEFEGYQVVEAVDGLDAINHVQHEQIDLVLMDVMMPHMDGFEAIKRIRALQPHIGIIMLTALGEEYDKVHGFDLGVDDYVVKPFSGRELMMRIGAVLRRSSTTPESTNLFVREGLKIDFDAHTVSIHDKRVDLSLKEYDLLAYLAQHEGQVLRREQLLEHIWGPNFYGDERTLDTHIKLLRKDLEEYSNYIVTVRGVGYRFEKEHTTEN